MLDILFPVENFGIGANSLTFQGNERQQTHPPRKLAVLDFDKYLFGLDRLFSGREYLQMKLGILQI